MERLPLLSDLFLYWTTNEVTEKARGECPVAHLPRSPGKLADSRLARAGFHRLLGRALSPRSVFVVVSALRLCRGERD